VESPQEEQLPLLPLLPHPLLLKLLLPHQLLL
jgi:hypothetical protein